MNELLLAAALLRDATGQISALEALADRAPAMASASGWVGGADARSYCESGPMTVAALPPRDRELLQACAAFVRRDPEVCREIPGAFVSKSPQNCRSALEHLALFADVVIGGPGSAQVCRTCFGIANPRLEQDEREKACAALAGPGEIAARCAAYRASVPRPFMGAQFSDCTNLLAYAISGRGCESFHPAATQNRLCAAFAAYRSGSCGDEYLCRALSGESRACRDQQALLVRRACAALGAGRAGPSTASPELRAEVARTLAWGAYLQALAPASRAALFRLHEAMLGARPLAGEQALADMAAVRVDAADDLLYRARQLAAREPVSAEARQAAELGVRLEKARRRLP